jgi:predicted permease
VIARLLSAFWKVRAPNSFAPDSAVPFAVDYRVLAFAMVIASVVAVAFALLPALELTRPVLYQSVRGEPGGIRPSRLRSCLLGAQVAVCLLLLITGGVVLRKSTEMSAFDPGFQAHGVFVVEAPKKRLPEVAELLNRQSWMEPVAFAQRAPVDELNTLTVGIPGAKGRTRIRANFVSAEYFSVLRMPVIRGRNFSNGEAISTAPVAVVSDATARDLWPGDTAVGKIIQIDPGESSLRRSSASVEVIGVVKDVANGGVYAGVDRRCVYFPAHFHGTQDGLLLARGKADITAMPRLAKKAMAEIPPPDSADESWYTDPFTPLEAGLEMQMVPLRTASWLASLLAALALLLTVSGVYGVVSYLVSQRTREIGIRMALGATRASVVRLVLGQSVKIAFGGMTLGVLLALAASKILAANLVLGITRSFDLVAYGGGVALVIVVAAGAALGPARRAARLEPSETLRAE